MIRISLSTATAEASAWELWFSCPQVPGSDSMGLDGHSVSSELHHSWGTQGQGLNALIPISQIGTRLHWCPYEGGAEVSDTPQGSSFPEGVRQNWIVLLLCGCPAQQNSFDPTLVFFFLIFLGLRQDDKPSNRVIANCSCCLTQEDRVIILWCCSTGFREWRKR